MKPKCSKPGKGQDIFCLPVLFHCAIKCKCKKVAALTTVQSLQDYVLQTRQKVSLFRRRGGYQEAYEEDDASSGGGRTSLLTRLDLLEAETADSDLLSPSSALYSRVADLHSPQHTGNSSQFTLKCSRWFCERIAGRILLEHLCSIEFLA